MIVAAVQPPARHAGRNLLIAVAGFGVTMILFALSTNFYLSLVVLAFFSVDLPDATREQLEAAVDALPPGDEQRDLVGQLKRCDIEGGLRPATTRRRRKTASCFAAPASPMRCAACRRRTGRSRRKSPPVDVFSRLSWHPIRASGRCWR